MRARKNRKTDDVDALVARRATICSGVQANAVIGHFEAAFGGPHRDLLGAVGMAVESRLANKKSDIRAEARRERDERRLDIVQRLR